MPAVSCNTKGVKVVPLPCCFAEDQMALGDLQNVTCSISPLEDTLGTLDVGQSDSHVHFNTSHRGSDFVPIKLSKVKMFFLLFLYKLLLTNLNVISHLFSPPATCLGLGSIISRGVASKQSCVGSCLMLLFAHSLKTK